MFVILDDVQFTKNDWRNRNRIKTKDGALWLTIPVVHKFGQRIKDTVIDDKSGWLKKHIQSFKTWYGRSRFFKDYEDMLVKMYAHQWRFLVDIDMEMVLWIKGILGISCDVKRSSELDIRSDDRQMRLIEICKMLNGNLFYEGKSGQRYMDKELFELHGITVQFQDYIHPFYSQLWSKEQGFISHLSSIDLLFNHGPDSLLILTGQKIMPPPEGMRIRHADEL